MSMLQNLEDKTARMRKDYEERLEELAESKRQALREMNRMFEIKLEEKEMVLQEVTFLLHCKIRNKLTAYLVQHLNKYFSCKNKQTLKRKNMKLLSRQ